MIDDSIDTLRGLFPRRYRLEREIARGGMSHVYLARENHPDRQVAIKVMDAKLSGEGRQRFLREVDVTSKLSHPHIVPIFAAGEAGGSLYYVMPYIEGETLAARIEREGPLPVGEAVEIALDVARALHHAHQKGIIHRDVKPGNILFQDGHALVADFGIARARDEADTRVTREGHTLGTVEYMAPEQATGSARVDGRSDQYSLGCILYEMLAGEPPFQGKTSQSTLARHMSEAVPPLRALRRGVSAEVEGVVLRSLEKAPQDRFPTLAEFSDALRKAFALGEARARRPGAATASGPGRRGSLRWITVGVPALVLLALAVMFAPWPGSDADVLAGGVYRVSVAVLPPEGRVVGPATGTDPDQLAEALASEISTALARVPWVRVSPFYTVRAVQSANLSVPQLLDTLAVEHILHGSLTLQGERINIQMAHVDGKDRHEAGRQFTITIQDWLEEQPRIAGEVARDFVDQYGGEEATVLLDPPTPGSGQRDFLNGNRFLGRRTPEGLRLAIRSYWTAVEKDPEYGPAYAQLSSTYALALTYRYDLGLDEYVAAGLADALASRAVELNPNGASGYASRSYIRALAGAPTAVAAADIDRARRLEPNNPSVPSWSARVHTMQGDLEEALAEAVRAAELDQLGSGRQLAVAYQAFHMGRHELAVRYSDMALELEPGLMLPRVIKARALVLLGRPGECLDMELGPHAGARALCLEALGDHDRALAIVDSLAAAYGPEPIREYTPVTVAEDLAVFHGYTGNVRQALRWIGTAYERSPTGIEVRILESDLFDPVRGEPGFTATVDRIRSGLWDRVRASWEGPLVRPDG